MPLPWSIRVMGRGSSYDRVSPPVGFFASPGTHGGTGTFGNPWDLPTALAQTGTLTAGVTLWLRGGIYNDSNNYTPTISGVQGNPVIIRSYPGELAQLVGPSRNGTQVGVLDLETGHDRRIMDLRVYCSDPDRTSLGERISGIVLGLRDDAINNFIHDVGQGVTGFFDGPSIIYGNLIFYCGSDNDWNTRSHNLYIHNAASSIATFKQLRHNVNFRASGFNHQLFASGTVGNSQVNYIHNEQNVAYDSGILDSSLGSSREFNFFIGVGDPGVARTIGNTYDGNINYNQSTTGSGGGPIVDYGACKYGDQVVTNGYQIRGNTGINDITTMTYTNNFVYVEGSPSDVNLMDVTTLANFAACDNNTYRADASLTTPFRWHGSSFNFANWKTNSGLDAASTFTTGKPASPKVFVFPNEYRAGRGLITIMNWPLNANVSVDFSSVLSPGDNYQVMDVNNYFGSPIASGTYGGGTVSLSMGPFTCQTPIGYSTPAALGPEWNCFILNKV